MVVCVGIVEDDAGEMKRQYEVREAQRKEEKLLEKPEASYNFKNLPEICHGDWQNAHVSGHGIKGRKLGWVVT